jgi:hypothetical protein
VLDQPLQEFVKRAAIDRHELFYHPATIIDIERDKNVKRKERSLSSLCKYSKLENHKFLSSEIDNIFGEKKSPNDDCDNLILHSLYSNCADFLVTEDIGVHRKAKTLNISERVLYIQQASTLLSSDFKEENFKFPGIKELYLSELRLGWSIFDSLLGSYGKFEIWFQKCQRKGRKCWAINETGDLDALAIFKKEKSPIITLDDKGLRGDVLKICTFKVALMARGKHYGELLLKKIFNAAFENDDRYIYITIRVGEQPHLRDLLESNGFYFFGQTKTNDGNIDDVYVKNMCVDINEFNGEALSFSIKLHPYFVINENTKFFCIPIKPKYHRHLFPEVQIQHELIGQGAIVGNSIRQAYICNSNSNMVVTGAIVFFYRSGDHKEITTYGIVEKVERTQDEDRAIQLTRKRTIYSDEDIKHACIGGALIILFRVLGHLDAPVTREHLLEMGVLGNIQSIRNVKQAQAIEILNTNEKRSYIFANKT